MFKLSIRTVGMIPVILASLILCRPTSAAETHGALIVAPARGTKVKSRHELVGKLLTRGYPIVLVRANQPGSQWWVQHPIQTTAPQTFQAKLQIGNERTPNGTEFRVVVMVAETEQEALRFKPGEPVRSLPVGVPRSAEVRVVFDRGESGAELGHLILKPQPNEVVSRKDEIRGRLPFKCVPIVLVRSVLPNSYWWIQAPADTTSDGRFDAQLRFGNDKTPPGAKFRVVVIGVKDRQEAESYQVGGTLAELPDGLPRSEEIVVIRDEPVPSEPTQDES
jgi:hypothetical protein